MDEKVNRLLFSGEPYKDEGFISYIMRLTEMNEIPDIRWILKTIRPGKFYKYDYRDSFDKPIDRERLAKITGVDKKILDKILYSCDMLRVDPDFFGKRLKRKFITRENPKICPMCLVENNYCRKIWEFALLTTCPIHKCFLLDYCPNCLRRIDWARPRINICQCNFDFRSYKIFHLKEFELGLSKYFYQHFNLYTEQPEFTFGYPLKSLSFDDLLKVLLFVIEYFSLYGNLFILPVKHLHHCLTSAITVFEDWEENYHAFIKDWHKRRRSQFIQRRAMEIQQQVIPTNAFDYEIFNYVIYEYFQGKQFAFLRRGFETFFERFLAGEISDEPSFFDNYDWYQGVRNSEIHEFLSLC